MRKVNVKVVQKDEKNPTVHVEVIAEAILRMSDGIKKLRSGPINDTGLMLLIQHAAPRSLSIVNIRAVLDGIQSLEKTYLKNSST
jgi:hypothetical protein